MMTQHQIVRTLVKRQGKRSDTAFAAELGISTSYWSLIRMGLRDPGPKLIKALGMRKVYVRNGSSNGNGRSGNK